MDEADNRMETEGKGLFIIRNGQKVSPRLGSGCRYFRESSSVTHPMALRLKCRIRPPASHRDIPDLRLLFKR